MNINKVDNVKFEAGNVYLKRIQADNIPSYKAIKKIAEDKDIDIFISKNKESRFLPSENMYLVIASKERPIVTRSFFQIGKDITHGTGCTILDKNTSPKELSVRIFNTTMCAIDALEARLGINKQKPLL